MQARKGESVESRGRRREGGRVGGREACSEAYTSAEDGVKAEGSNGRRLKFLCKLDKIRHLSPSLSFEMEGSIPSNQHTICVPFQCWRLVARICSPHGKAHSSSTGRPFHDIGAGKGGGIRREGNHGGLTAQSRGDRWGHQPANGPPAGAQPPAPDTAYAPPGCCNPLQAHPPSLQAH